jgi:hypothetical protein
MQEHGNLELTEEGHELIEDPPFPAAVGQADSMPGLTGSIS